MPGIGAPIMNTLYIDPQFAALLPESQARVIAASHATIYVLDRLLAIRAYNDAYVRFGTANGCPDIGRSHGIGCRLIAVLPAAAAEIYVPAYLRAMETGTPFEHDYECSSAQVFRRYQQTAYPLRDGLGLVVANHLVYEAPHAWRPQATGPRHFDRDGWLAQCACCRRLRDSSHPEKWDWVPAVVETPHPRTTHTYCLNCLNFYYGDVLGEHAPAPG